MGLKSTLGKTVGGLIRVNRSKDLAGDKEGGAARNGQLNSRYVRQDALPVPPGISATGGQSTYVYNGKKIHVWTTEGSGTPFNVTSVGPTNDTIEYFIVAGGGGAGGDSEGDGGGGGAGGVLTGTIPIQGGTVTVTLGAGGVGGNTNGAPGVTGSDSSIAGPGLPATFTALGGGGGAGANPALSGGSGGGGGGDGPGTPGSATNYPGPTAQGYPGGAGNLVGGKRSGGGGGGAGGAGEAGASPRQGGNGGLGVLIPATFRDPTNKVGGRSSNSSNDWGFAGGGAGGFQATQGPGSGGEGGVGPTGSPNAPLFGGGNYQTSAANPTPNGDGRAGWSNTGGGGGGGAGNNTPAKGGPGFIAIAYTPQ